jgi:diaminobutyrate-2-oxoglutarate transaminase
MESNVRSYCRTFPVTFSGASGVWLRSDSGREYLDLLSGAGSLNYGHNHPCIIEPVIAYLREDNIVHSLDLHTTAKARFLEDFDRIILRPRNLTYKCQFPGPTGTNAVEAALKLARKVTGRSNVIAFTNAYHGMTLGALALTTNSSKRGAAGVPLGHVTFMPYEGYLGSHIDTMDIMTAMLERPGSGVDRPAAIVLELVQGEGGLACAQAAWATRVADLAKRIGALLIVDDIQAGCGRTGTFFSFEPLGLRPDIVTLSKSLSGFGTPFSMVLISPELDVWAPGEHNGTFRGNNLAFVGASAALGHFWTDDTFSRTVQQRSELLRDKLEDLCAEYPAETVHVKGRGLMMGLEFARPEQAALASKELFKRGIVIETCGERDRVLKFLPPLIISNDELLFALGELSATLAGILSKPQTGGRSPLRSAA